MTLQPNDFWYTPPEVYADVIAFMGAPFDPCPANPKYDGLEIAWGKDCYINPPYSKILKRAFINKAIRQYGQADRYLWMFNYANSKDLHEVKIRASAVLMPEKRFEFVPGHPLLSGHPENPDPEKRKPGSPQYDNIMILWGDPARFKECFGKWGSIFYANEYPGGKDGNR